MNSLLGMKDDFGKLHSSKLEKNNYIQHHQSFWFIGRSLYIPGLSSLGVPGVPWHPQFLADQLTLSQPWGADYAYQIILPPPRIFRPSYGPVVDYTVAYV